MQLRQNRQSNRFVMATRTIKTKVKMYLMINLMTMDPCRLKLQVRNPICIQNLTTRPSWNLQPFLFVHHEIQSKRRTVLASKEEHIQLSLFSSSANVNKTGWKKCQCEARHLQKSMKRVSQCKYKFKMGTNIVSSVWCIRTYVQYTTVYYSVFSVLNDLVSHKSCYMFQKISQHVNNCLFCTDALISPERHASFKTTGL